MLLPVFAVTGRDVRFAGGTDEKHTEWKKQKVKR